MKLSLFALLTLCVLGFAQGQESKKTVAVYVTGDNKGYANVLSETFKEVFTDSKNYAAVERTSEFLEMLRKEFDYQGTGNVDDNQLATLGKQNGADYVSIIEVIKVGEWHFIASRMISTEKAAIVAASDGNGRITDLKSLMELSKEAAEGLLKSAESKRDFSKSKRVAVFTGGSSEDNKLLGVKLVSAITNSNEYVAMERTSEFLGELNKEIEYQRSGNVDESQLAALGKQFGVDLVCASKISNELGSNFLTVSLLNANSAIIERKANTDFSYKNDFERFEKIRNVTDRLLLSKEELLAEEERSKKAKEAANELARKEKAAADELTRKEAAKWRTSTKVAFSLDLLGLGLIAGGIWLNKDVNTYLDDYNTSNSRESHTSAKDAASKRNLAYGIGAALLASGIVVHVAF